MLKILKNLFKSEPEVVDITIDDLPEYVNKENKKLQERSKEQLDPLLKSLEQISEKIADNLSILKDAELQNKKIPTRARQIMQGNRETYIKNTKYFLNRLDTEADIKEFIECFDNDLEKLSSANSRPSMVMKEFFSNEVSAIARNIKEMVDAVKEIKKLDKQMTSGKFETISKYIQDLSHAKNQAKERNRELEMLQKEQTKIQEQQNKIQKQIKTIQDSDDYKQMTLLSEKKKKTEIALEELESSLLQKTGTLDSMLRKYERISMNPGIIKSFLKNPLKCIDSNPDETVNMIESLTKSISSGKIDAKQKKSQKAIDAAQNLDKSNIWNIKKDLDKLNDDKKEHDELLKKSSVTRDFDELEYQLTHILQKEEQLNSRIKETQKYVNKNTEESIIEKIKKSAKEEGIIVS